eukprot:3260665-Rhodomonas_salina.2
MAPRPPLAKKRCSHLWQRCLHFRRQFSPKWHDHLHFRRHSLALFGTATSVFMAFMAALRTCAGADTCVTHVRQSLRRRRSWTQTWARARAWGIYSAPCCTAVSCDARTGLYCGICRRNGTGLGELCAYTMPGTDTAYGALRSA